MMKKNISVINDKHGKCLCIENQPEFKVVTTNTREGPGLWEKYIKSFEVANFQKRIQLDIVLMKIFFDNLNNK